MDIENTHQESNVKIYWTKKYDQFNTIKGNRQLVERNVNKIVHQISNGNNLLKHYPILVNEEMGVEDGQHRLEAAKRTKQNIYYTINKRPHNLIGIATLNNNNEKWKTEDYINCFIKSGIEDYRILRNFMHKYDLTITISLPLLQEGKLDLNSKERGPIKKMFKEGLFKVKHLEAATEFMDKLSMFGSFKSYKTRHFATAISRVIKAEKIELTQLAKKFNPKGDSFAVQKSSKDYLAALEIDYNRGLHNRFTIF